MGFDEVLGSVSGRDNCVFLCLREGISGEDFLETLKLKIPELDD
jgi:transcriptional regulator of arginine metabolism